MLMCPLFQLKNKSSEEAGAEARAEARAYDMLVRNCQEFATLLMEKICEEEPQTITPRSTEPVKRKRRGLRKKMGKFLKVVFLGSGRGFKKLGTGFWKRALMSSLSNPQFIMPPPR